MGTAQSQRSCYTLQHTTPLCIPHTVQCSLTPYNVNMARYRDRITSNRSTATINSHLCTQTWPSAKPMRRLTSPHWVRVAFIGMVAVMQTWEALASLQARYRGGCCISLKTQQKCESRGEFSRSEQYGRKKRVAVYVGSTQQAEPRSATQH